MCGVFRKLDGVNEAASADFQGFYQPIMGVIVLPVKALLPPTRGSHRPAP